MVKKNPFFYLMDPTCPDLSVRFWLADALFHV